jgi:hypothetical protein
VTGDFDPKQEEAGFFEVIQTSFNLYCQAFIDKLLDEFDITVMFMEDLTQSNTTGASGLPITSWCEVNVTFMIGSEIETDLDAFTVDKATQFVSRFFLSSQKTRLINGMGQAGIDLDDIQPFYVLPDDVQEKLKADSEQTKDEPMTQQSSSDGSKSALFVAVASGGVIFLALGAVLVSNRRRTRNMNTYGKESHTGDGSSYSDGSASQAVSFVSGQGTSEVLPAALHVRNKRERERQLMMSSNSTVSSYRTTETACLSKKTKTAGEAFDGTAAYSTGQGVHETALVRLEDGPELVASGALTCLDGDESVGALNEAYPEFDLYQTNASPPPSPVWSVDNFSNASPYSAEEDYLVARRRWHDEANDLELIALPDNESDVGSMSHFSHSVTDEGVAGNRMGEV